MINIRNEELIVAIGKRVRALRHQRNLTIEQLSALANIEYRQVSDVERGKSNSTVSTLFAIAQALEVSLAELLTLENF